MTFPVSPEDRPDPADQHAVRARVPDHVARGVFSTGVIVMTAPTEFVIDFIQNLGRPHQVVARIVMPHPVMPQFVDALLKNIELYRGRYGNLPQPNLSGMTITAASGQVHPGQATPQPQTQTALNSTLPKSPSYPGQGVIGPASSGVDEVGAPIARASGTSAASGSAGGAANSPNSPGPSGSAMPGNLHFDSVPPVPSAGGVGAGGVGHEAVPPQNVRRASAQEIYDDLKLRDEILSGSYANAVMIGHGPHEFSFDFITNFYPHSAVSARVFLAAGQVARLADSLKGAWDQIRYRFGQPPGPEGEQPGT